MTGYRKDANNDRNEEGEARLLRPTAGSSPTNWRSRCATRPSKRWRSRAEVVVPSEKDTNVGTVVPSTRALKSRRCSVRAVDGIVVSAVNFGDEQSVAVAIKDSGLKVPNPHRRMSRGRGAQAHDERRDSFCGLLSIARPSGR